MVDSTQYTHLMQMDSFDSYESEDSAPTLVNDSHYKEAMPCDVLDHNPTPIVCLYENVFEDVHVIGSGATATVQVVTRLSDGKKMACKIVDCNKVPLSSIRNEVKILAAINHPGVVQLDNVFVSGMTVYIVLELCEGGDLFENLFEGNRAHPEKRFSEEEVKTIVQQMVEIVGYLHSIGICHRDLKLENFMFGERGNIHSLKLIDFGFGTFFTPERKMTEVVGTSYSMAPEVYAGWYDHRCDLWSIGVLVFELVVGLDPFYHEEEAMVRDKIYRGDYDFDNPKWKDDMSTLSMIFVSGLLQVDPELRMTSEDAAGHEWFQYVYF